MSEVFEQLFYRPIVFNEIERTVWPPSWLGHTPFALWLMDELRPQTFVELGTHSGNSFCAFCQGAEILGYTPQLTAIDTWQGDPHAGSYPEEVFSELSDYIEARYQSAPRLLRTTFEEAVETFQDQSVDLLNIDGYHTYEATADNFNSWLPKMSARGVVLIHDIAVKRDDFGAWKFWDEIKNRYPTFSFLHSHGLGVVFVGNETAPGVQWLTDPTRDYAEVESVRSLFSSLGGGAAIKCLSRRKGFPADLGQWIDPAIIRAYVHPPGLDPEAAIRQYCSGLEESLRQHATTITTLTANLEAQAQLYAEAAPWQNLGVSRLGRTSDEAIRRLDQLTAFEAALQSPLHRSATWVSGVFDRSFVGRFFKQAFRQTFTNLRNEIGFRRAKK